MLPALEEMAGFSALKILGLMGIAPFSPILSRRPYFRRLYQLFNAIQVAGAKMKYLSMGMTNDFEVAIEEVRTWSGWEQHYSVKGLLNHREEISIGILHSETVDHRERTYKLGVNTENFILCNYWPGQRDY